MFVISLSLSGLFDFLFGSFWASNVCTVCTHMGLELNESVQLFLASHRMRKSVISNEQTIVDSFFFDFQMIISSALHTLCATQVFNWQNASVVERNAANFIDD